MPRLKVGGYFWKFQHWRKIASNLRRKWTLLLKPTRKVFNDIYYKNLWGDRESVSGPGSRLDRTDKVRRSLPQLINQFHIRSILDIPCGDFNWMKLLSLDIEYLGADIVPDLVRENQIRYEDNKRKFMLLNLLQDSLPAVDLILCRDCLVHFSNSDIKKAINNIKGSKSNYLLVTTFSERRQNTDIVTGEWHPVNLCLPPFNFPLPLEYFDDSYDSPYYFDKRLGLWKIMDLPKF